MKNFSICLRIIELYFSICQNLHRNRVEQFSISGYKCWAEIAGPFRFLLTTCTLRLPVRLLPREGTIWRSLANIFRRQQEQLLQHPLLSPLFKLSIIFWIQRRQLYNLHCCPNCLSCPETFPVSVTELDRQRRTPFIVGWVVTLHPNRSYRRATLHLDLNQRFVRKAIRRKGCTTDFWYFRTAKKQRRIGTPGCPVATGRRGRLWAECP